MHKVFIPCPVIDTVMSKGMELPINMIVVVLIAVLVLTTVGIFLTRQLGGGASTIDWQQKWGQACTQLRFQFNCNPNDAGISQMSLGTDSNGNQITFAMACQGATSNTDPLKCKQLCGC